MKIIKMTIKDYEDAFKLWESTEGVGLRGIDDSREGIDMFLKRNPNTNFVCREGQELIGTILSGHDGRRGYIYHTVVKPSYRRCGIANQLVEKAIQELKAEGINKVALVVFSDNKEGSLFWESLGFTKRSDLIYRNIAINNNDL